MIFVGEKPANWALSLMAAFQQVSPSTIGHMTDTGFMKGLHSLSGGRLVGRAVTVKIPHLDSAAVHVAVNELEPGDVLVVDMNGDFDRASVGGIVAYAANVRGAAGIIVDGGITDVEEIRALDGLRVYYRTISALTTRALGIEGEVHVPIAVGGAAVLPGDLILGDESGVMALRGSGLAELATMAYDKEQGEVQTKQKLDAGIPLMQLSRTDQFVQKKRD